MWLTQCDEFVKPRTKIGPSILEKEWAEYRSELKSLFLIVRNLYLNFWTSTDYLNRAYLNWNDAHLVYFEFICISDMITGTKHVPCTKCSGNNTCSYKSRISLIRINQIDKLKVNQCIIKKNRKPKNWFLTVGDCLWHWLKLLACCLHTIHPHLNWMYENCNDHHWSP